jgi:hypothetical protein
MSAKPEPEPVPAKEADYEKDDYLSLPGSPERLFDLIELIRSQREDLESYESSINYDPQNYQAGVVRVWREHIRKLEDYLEARVGWCIHE